MNAAKEMQAKGVKATSRVALGAALLVAVLGVCTSCAGEHHHDKNKNNTTKNSEAIVTTNENGSVSRRYIESVVTTNGNMVCERRRETNTTMDADGNVLVSSTSEYTQSYSSYAMAKGPCPKRSCKGKAPEGAYPPPNCFKKGAFPPPPPPPTGLDCATNTDVFMGLKFNSVFTANTNFVVDAAEPALLRTTFTPKKALADFDDYYVYVTPTTHKVAKVVACARAAVDSGIRWKRHYLIEALERRYETWARLCSFSRPCYDFHIGPRRGVRVCLADATPDYQTVIEAWDEEVIQTAAEEYEAALQEVRRTSAEERGRRVNEAAEAF